MDSDTGLEESMRQLWLEPGDPPQYPERPGEPYCGYYMRTGACGFGDRCRFNHPRDRSVAGGGGTGGVEYPQRAGQPACQYFLKTGTCKFGVSCKYDHPMQGGGSSDPVLLNYSGYPIRPGERDCAYYMKTGRCKFGSTCKFHHPDYDGSPLPPSEPGVYSTLQAPAMASWQVERPVVLPPPFIPTYGSVWMPQNVMSFANWSPYVAQQGVQPGQLAGSPSHLPPAPLIPGPYITESSAGPSSSVHREQPFPERPGQQECQYFMRTGDCRYGQSCKYHHPPEWRTPRVDCVLSPLGLPLRPGAQPCAFYAQHGVCKFGPTCKFDHPMGLLSYSPSASSLVDMPVAPYPVGFSLATFAPSSSSSELPPGFISTSVSLSARVPSAEGMPSGLIASMFSESSSASQSLQFSSQTHNPGGSEFSGLS